MSNQEEASAAAARADGPEAISRFVHDAVQKRLRTLELNIAAARSGEDVEALHDLRVASRRLRASVTLFADLLSGKRVRRCGKLLRKLTRLLGAPREWDVHAETLARLHAATPHEGERAATEHLLELVDARRGHERAEMTRRLGKIDLDTISRDIRWLSDHVATVGVPMDLAHAAFGVLQPLAREAFTGIARLRERERPDDLHALRIQCKHLRYALELLEPAFADGHAKLLSRCRQLQEVLGRHHDLVVLEELLTRTLGRLSAHGRTALAEGLLGPLERLRSERREQYVEFCDATSMLDVEAFTTEVRRGLRLA